MADIGTDSVASTTPQKRRKTRQRVHKPPPTLDVPDINDDALERKRVLNVLAQRRYRRIFTVPGEDLADIKKLGQRKRQQKVVHPSECDNSSGAEGDPSANTVAKPDTGRLEITSAQHNDNGPLTTMDESPSNLPSSQDPEIIPDLRASAVTCCPELQRLLQATENSISPLADGGCDVATDNALSLSCPYLDLDPSIFTDLPFIDYAALCPTVTGPVVPQSIPPDSYLLPLPELRLLQAFIRIAHDMNCKSSIWDLTATSPINDDWVPANPRVWTSTFAPTVAQRTIPHHPLIDLMPWPSVRDKLINIFSLPSDLRPPASGGPLAIMQLAYDMEDSAEGIRIWGHSLCNCNMWEIGQALFQRWWFVFDRQVIDQSNRWRTLRGAPELKLAGDQERVQEL